MKKTIRKLKNTTIPKTQKVLIGLTALLFAGLGSQEVVHTFSVGGRQPANHPIIVFNADRKTYRVIEVLDGDTIRIDIGETVRYMGIDAPEKNDYLGLSAQRYHEKLTLGKDIRLEFDREKTDKYGRILAYVYVGDQLINEKMVEEGYAHPLWYNKMYKPKLYDRLLKAEQWAKDHHNGIWLDEWRK